LGNGGGKGRVGIGIVDDGRSADARYSVRGSNRSRRATSDRKSWLLQGARQTHSRTAQSKVRYNIFLSRRKTLHLVSVKRWKSIEKSN